MSSTLLYRAGRNMQLTMEGDPVSWHLTVCRRQTALLLLPVPVQFEPFSVPELLRVPLESVVLQIKMLFPRTSLFSLAFLDHPPAPALATALANLLKHGALEEDPWYTAAREAGAGRGWGRAGAPWGLGGAHGAHAAGAHPSAAACGRAPGKDAGESNRSAAHNRLRTGLCCSLCLEFVAPLLCTLCTLYSAKVTAYSAASYSSPLLAGLQCLYSDSLHCCLLLFIFSFRS